MLSTSSSTTIIVHHPDHPDLVCTAHNLGKHFKAQLVRGRGCLFCGIRVGAPARHCAQCTVLFQLTIAVAYCQDGRHGGLQKLAEDLFTACFPSGGAPALHSPAQPPTTPLVPAANKRQRQNAATTRGCHQLGSTRSGAGSLHQAGPPQHSAIDAPGSEGVEGIGAGLSGEGTASENSSHLLSGARAASKTSDGAGYSRRAGNCHQDGATDGRRLGLPEVVPQGQEAGDGHKPPADDARQRGKDAQCSQGWPHRRRDSAVQGHTRLGGDRSHGSAVGHVSAAGFSSGHHGGEPLSLAHNALTHLVGISVKRQSPMRSQLANQLAALTFGS